MDTQRLRNVKEYMEEAADTREALMQFVLDAQRNQESNRNQAEDYARKTEEEVDRLLTEAYGIVAQRLGFSGNPLETPGWQRNIHFGRDHYLREVDRAHERLQDEELDRLYEQLRDAQLRYRLARSERKDANLDVDWERAVARQIIARFREIFTGLIAQDQTSFSSEDPQELEDLKSFVEDLEARLRRAEHYVVKRLPHTSISPLTPSDISKARLVAREDVDYILKLFANDSKQ
jgi:hypothetical protein